MNRHDLGDVVSGLVLVLFGLAVFWYATTQLNTGTLQRMGPGMFPAGLGGVTGLLGAVLAFSGWRRQSDRLGEINWRALIAVLLGILAFAFLIRTSGLVPAVVAVVTLSAFGEPRPNLRNLLFLNLGLSVMAVSIFHYALGMNLAIARWPF